MAGGIPFAFLLGGLANYWRIFYGWKAGMKFKVLPPSIKPRSIHHFW
jgi:hypothetical protein